MALAVAVSAEGKAPLEPIAPGLYCLREALNCYTGTGQRILLGSFIMSVKVSKKRDRYAVSIANRMPDSPEIFSAETEDARVSARWQLGFLLYRRLGK